MNCSFYKNIRSKQGKDVHITRVLKAIKTGEWDDVINPIRKLEGDEYDEAKKNVACFIPSGTFSDQGKSAKYMKKHSGLCCIDLDEGIIGIDDIKEMLGKDKYCFAVFLSVGGNGLAFLAKIPADTSTHEYHYKWLCKYIKDKYGVYGSDSQANVNRLRYVSYDPKLIYNPKSEICTETLLDEVTPWSEILEVTDTDYGEIDLDLEKGRYQFCRMVQDKNFKFVEGKRNNYVAKLCFYLNEMAVTQSFAVKQLPLDFEEPGFPAKEIRNVVQSAYNSKRDQFGIKFEKIKKERAEGPQSARAKKNKKIIEMINDMGVVYNQFSQDFDRNHVVVDQLEYNTIYLNVMERVNLSLSLFSTLFHSTRVNKFNPIVDFIEKNYNYESKGCIEHWASCIDSSSGFIGPDDYDGNFQLDFMRKWYVALIAQALGDTDRDRNEWFLALLGVKHGTGKTRFLTEFTLPDELRRYGTSRAIGESKDEDYMLLLCQMLILVDDELDGKGWQDMKNFKSIMSKKRIAIRRKYDRKYSHMLRRASLCGTGNEHEVITEYSNRRIIPIQVNSVNLEECEKVDRVGLFMEAYHLYRSGFEWWFTESDRERLMAVSEDFRSPTVVGEYLTHWVDLPINEQDQSDPIPVIDIMTFLKERYPSGRFTPKAIGQIMNEMGFEKLRTRSGNKRAVAYIISKKSKYFDTMSNAWLTGASVN